MKGLIDLFGEPDADTFDPGDILHAGAGELLQAAELLQKLLTTFRPDARDLFQDRTFSTARPAVAMGGNGKTMGLIPDLLDQVQSR